MSVESGARSTRVQISGIEPRYMTRPEVARFLGCTPDTVSRRAAACLLPPPVYLGPKERLGRPLWNRVKLLRFLDTLEARQQG